eukprot:GGOE01019363.1.p1 GENE.GGOE01019363.1~~GGOE01019363.1.p1  ORF type:complete len:342 (+),score=59.48 GGOE01019363.1:37-1026(+)
MNPKCTNIKGCKSPQATVQKYFQDNGLCDLSFQIPKKWEKVGHVLILHREPEQEMCEALVAKAFLSAFEDVDVIVIDDCGVQGELRQPTARVALRRDLGKHRDSTEVLHIENGVRFKWDVLQVMFSSGNTKERIRFRREVEAKDEVVVDMFAGLGYFSIPLAMADAMRRPSRIFCIEKNPTSHRYLLENVRLNGVGHIVEAVCGDNREVGEELLGHADRVLMGYLPTPLSFLPRAFRFLRPGGGVIHYHFTATKAEADGLPLQHVWEQLGGEVAGSPVGRDVSDVRLGDVTCSVLRTIRIKSYRPRVFHWVAELQFTRAGQGEGTPSPD